MSLIGKKEEVIKDFIQTIQDEYNVTSYGMNRGNNRGYAPKSLEELSLKLFLLQSGIDCSSEEDLNTKVMSCQPTSCSVKVVYNNVNGTTVYSQEGKLEYVTLGTEGNLVLFEELRNKEIIALFYDSYLYRQSRAEGVPSPGQFKFNSLSGLITFSDPLDADRWILIQYK